MTLRSFLPDFFLYSLRECPLINFRNDENTKLLSIFALEINEFDLKFEHFTFDNCIFEQKTFRSHLRPFWCIGIRLWSSVAPQDLPRETK